MKKFNFNIAQSIIIVVCFVCVLFNTGCSTLNKATTVDCFSCFENESFVYGTVPVKENLDFVKSTLNKNFLISEKDLSLILPKCNKIYFSLYSSEKKSATNIIGFQGIVTGNFPTKILSSILKNNKSIKQIKHDNLKYFQYGDLNLYIVNKNIILISTTDMLSLYNSLNRNLFSKTDKFYDSLLSDFDLLDTNHCIIYSDKVSDLLKMIPNNKITFPIEQMAFKFLTEKENANGELFIELKDSKFQRVANALFKLILPENKIKFVNDTTIYIPNVNFALNDGGEK